MLLELYWFTFGVLPYITLTIMVIGFVIQAAKWLTGSAVKFPRRGVINTLKVIGLSVTDIVLDFVFFRKVAQRDFKLWLMIWPLHISVGLIILSGFHYETMVYVIGLSTKPPYIPTKPHVLPLAKLPFEIPIAPPPLSIPHSAIVALSILALIEIAALLIRRIISKTVRQVSSFENYFDLVIILIAGSFGLMMDVLKFIGLNDVNLVILLRVLHGMFAQVYFMAMPFTFYLHIVPGGFVLKAAYASWKVEHGR